MSFQIQRRRRIDIFSVSGVKINLCRMCVRLTEAVSVLPISPRIIERWALSAVSGQSRNRWFADAHVFPGNADSVAEALKTLRARLPDSEADPERIYLQARQ